MHLYTLHNSQKYMFNFKNHRLGFYDYKFFEVFFNQIGWFTQLATRSFRDISIYMETRFLTFSVTFFSKRQNFSKVGKKMWKLGNMSKSLKEMSEFIHPMQDIYARQFAPFSCEQSKLIQSFTAWQWGKDAIGKHFSPPSEENLTSCKYLRIALLLHMSSHH